MGYKIDTKSVFPLSFSVFLSIIVNDLFHDDYRALKDGILLVGTYKYCIITFIIELSLFCCFYIAI